MNEPSDQPTPKPDKTWLSSFMLALGVLSMLAAIFGFATGGFMGGLLGLAIAAVFLTFGRILDYLQEILFRLDRLEKKDERK